ncbi:MAG: VOC family protein [Candidatus Latescibacterota bacterium]|jgi:hypothetical protein
MTTREIGRVDHLIYGTPDLEATVDELASTLGLRATIGGQHPGEGTRNALFSLGPGRYLEIMAPDPSQPDPDGPRWLGIDDLTSARMVAWAAKSDDLASLSLHAAQGGIELGPILSGGRVRPDGSHLSWRLTDPRQWIADGVVPFFIDWGGGAHPSESAIEGLSLVAFRIEHPDHAYVGSVLEQLGLETPVDPGIRPALVATLKTPLGLIELT